MLRIKTHSVIRFLELFMQFLIGHIFLCLTLGFFRGGMVFSSQILRMASLFFLIVLEAAARTRIKNIFLFTAVHMGGIAALVFLGEGNDERFCLLVIGTLFSINSFRYRLTESYLYKECPSIFNFVIFLIAALLSGYREWDIIKNLASGEMIGFLLLHLVQQNLKATEDFLELNADMANLPRSQMRGISRILLLLFLLLTSMGMMTLPMLHLEVPLKKIGGILLILTRAFFSLFHRKEYEEPITEAIIGEIPRGNGEFVFKPTQPLWIAIVLEQALRIAVFIGIFIAVGYLLYLLYRRFYERRTDDFDKKEFLFREEGKTSLKIFQNRRKEERDSGTRNQKMRKLYKKTVKKRKKRNTASGKILQTFTPDELEHYLAELEEKKVTQEQERLIRLYEKARYGEETCREEEWKEMKRLIQEM